MRIRLAVAFALWCSAFCAQEFAPRIVAGLTRDTSQLKGTITVVTFISARCVVSNAYGARLEAVYKEYTPRGVRFVFVNSNSNETAEEMAENARQHGFTFPIYQDTASKAADLFGAQFTPEAFVLNRDAVVRYHGVVDDSQNPARVKNRRLREALDSVLAGQPVAVPMTKGFGCTIKRPRAEKVLQPLDGPGFASLVVSHRDKILLVDFWATWCAPCRDELPQVAALAGRMPAGSFQLSTISADDPEQAGEALKLLRTSHAQEPFFLKSVEDNERFISSVDPAWSGALPAFFLYDRSGRLRRSFLGDVKIAEIETAIRKLL